MIILSSAVQFDTLYGLIIHNPLHFIALSKYANIFKKGRKWNIQINLQYSSTKNYIKILKVDIIISQSYKNRERHKK